MKAHRCPFCGSNRVGPQAEDGPAVANAFNDWNRRSVGVNAVSDGELRAFIERVGEFRAVRLWVGRRNGPIRWDVTWGDFDNTDSAPTLAEAIAKARSRA